MAYQSLLKEGRIDKDVVLLHGEIYVQKKVQFEGRRLIGDDGDGRMFKGIMTFMKDGDQVTAVIAGYAAKKMIERNKCEACKQLCKASEEEKHQPKNVYLNN